MEDLEWLCGRKVLVEEVGVVCSFVLSRNVGEGVVLVGWEYEWEGGYV